MTEAGRQRMRLVEAAFDEADQQLVEDGSAQELGGIRERLRVELAHWQAIGIGLGVFDGELIAPLPGVREDGFETIEEFQVALAAAMEDLRPERLELVRLMILASQDERTARLREVLALTIGVQREGLRDGWPVDRVAWALSGRQSALEDRPGPSAWRSNAAIEQSDSYIELNRVGGQLAAVALVAELADFVPRVEIIEAVAREAPGFGFGLAGA